MGLEMFKKVTKLLGAIALIGWMGVANATLIFDFSSSTARDDVIRGSILGIGDLTTDAKATSVYIYSINGRVVEYLFIHNPPMDTIFSNSFYFDAHGILQAMTFKAYINVGTSEQISLWLGGTLMRDFTVQVTDDSRRYEYDISGSPQLRAVPEPSSVILLSLSIVGLFLSRHRKQS
jgi:hypothetical protein